MSNEANIKAYIDACIEQKYQELVGHLMTLFPEQAYDLSKAFNKVPVSAFDSIADTVELKPDTNHWWPETGKNRYTSSFEDPSFRGTGTAFREPDRLAISERDYNTQKQYKQIAVSAFDNVATEESTWDRFNFNKKEVHVVTREELLARPYLFPEMAEVFAEADKEKQNDSLVVYHEHRLAETTLTLDTQADHHDKVLADVIHLMQKGDNLPLK
jgi:hypothetical protein